MFSDTSTLIEFRGPLGVRVKIGSSFLMLAFFILVLGGGTENLPFQLAFLAIIFVSVFAHEMGHAWGCLVQGVPVDHIMIHGGGGYCLPARSPSRREDEFMVAMGPIVNLGLWAIASLIAPYVSDPLVHFALRMFAVINLFLAIMNMLPVMPLDGGRLFHHLLLRFMAPRLATKVAGGVGLLIAIAWIPATIICYVYIGFILLFFPPIMRHWHMLRS